MLWVSVVHGASIDCPALINFASTLGMNTAQPAIMSKLNSNCCNAQAGVVCTSQRVTQVNWELLGLTGTIDGTSIPPLLTALNIGRNQLTGNIPTNWPSGLTYLDISRNPGLNCVSPGPWPSGLQELHLNGLSCTGDVGVFPNSMIYLYLGWVNDDLGTYNKLSGTIALNRPLELEINFNLITDIIITDSSQMDTYCDLSNNPLLGNPHIAGLTMCSQNGLYSPTLLPITLSMSSSSSSFNSQTTLKGTSTSAYQTVAPTAFKATTAIASSTVAYIPTSLSLPKSAATSIASSIVAYTPSVSTSSLFMAIVSSVSKGATAAIGSEATAITTTMFATKTSSYSETMNTIIPKFVRKATKSSNGISTTSIPFYTSTPIHKTVDSSPKTNNFFVGKDTSLVLEITIGNILRLLFNGMITAVIATKTPWIRKKHSGKNGDPFLSEGYGRSTF